MNQFHSGSIGIMRRNPFSHASVWGDNTRKVERIQTNKLRDAYQKNNSGLGQQRDHFKGSLGYQKIRNAADKVRETASNLMSFKPANTNNDDLSNFANSISDAQEDFNDISQTTGNQQTSTAATWLGDLSNRVTALTAGEDIVDPLSSEALTTKLDGIKGDIDVLSDELVPHIAATETSPEEALQALKTDLEAFASTYGASESITTAISEIDAALNAADGTIDITNLQAESGRDYTAGATLQVGEEVYSDRNYTFTDVGSFEGATLIQTANDDKLSEGNNFVTMDLDQNATVYVAFDTREEDIPAWLQDWEDTGEELASTDVTTLRVYKKEMGPGEVTIGGTEQDSWGRSNYSIFLTSDVPDLSNTLASSTESVRALRSEYSGEELTALNQVINTAMGLPDAEMENVASAFQALTQISERISSITPNDAQSIAQETFTRLNNLIGQIQEMDGSEEHYDTLQGQLGTLDGLRAQLEPHVERSTLGNKEKEVALDVISKEMEAVTTMLNHNPGSIEIDYSSSKPKTLSGPEEGQILTPEGTKLNTLTIDPGSLNTLDALTISSDGNSATLTIMGQDPFIDNLEKGSILAPPAP